MSETDAKHTIGQIQEEANQLLKKYHRGDFPINPIEIASDFGYEVYQFNPNNKNYANISGAVDKEKRKIFFNPSDSRKRIRFTIAHELGHAILHSDDSKVDYRTDPPSGYHDIKEVQANEFAGALLMPEYEFKREYNKTKDVSSVADYFDVSTLAAYTRAKRLGLLNDD